MSRTLEAELGATDDCRPARVLLNLHPLLHISASLATLALDTHTSLRADQPDCRKPPPYQKFLRPTCELVVGLFLS